MRFYVVFVWKSIFHGFHGNPWILRIKCPKFANLGQILLEIENISPFFDKNKPKWAYFCRLLIMKWGLFSTKSHKFSPFWAKFARFWAKFSHFWQNILEIEDILSILHHEICDFMMLVRREIPENPGFHDKFSPNGLNLSDFWARNEDLELYEL